MLAGCRLLGRTCTVVSTCLVCCCGVMWRRIAYPRGLCRSRPCSGQHQPVLAAMRHNCMVGAMVVEIFAVLPGQPGLQSVLRLTWSWHQGCMLLGVQWVIRGSDTCVDVDDVCGPAHAAGVSGAHVSNVLRRHVTCQQCTAPAHNVVIMNLASTSVCQSLAFKATAMQYDGRTQKSSSTVLYARCRKQNMQQVVRVSAAQLSQSVTEAE